MAEQLWELGAMQAKGLTHGVHRCYGTPVPHAALLALMLCNVPAMLFCGYLLLRALVRKHIPHALGALRVHQLAYVVIASGLVPTPVASAWVCLGSVCAELAGQILFRHCLRALQHSEQTHQSNTTPLVLPS